jgi:RNA polymerase sigma factor (TIGR02999 family)
VARFDIKRRYNRGTRKCNEVTLTSSEELTALLRAWSGGDQNALTRLVDLAYPELRKIARRCLTGERSGLTMQATALVHEAYLRLVDIRQMRWQERAQFFVIFAKVMRRILIEHARARDSAKRGAGAQPIDLNEALMISAKLDPEIARLDQALEDLAAFDARKAEVVEMRYFGGLTSKEIAAVLGVSPQSVNRDWSLAKAWLARALSRELSDGRPALGSN